jgi:hypothetical protein
MAEFCTMKRRSTLLAGGADPPSNPVLPLLLALPLLEVLPLPDPLPPLEPLPELDPMPPLELPLPLLPDILPLLVPPPPSGRPPLELDEDTVASMPPS